jgi:hypothetical protein
MQAKGAVTGIRSSSAGQAKSWGKRLIRFSSTSVIACNSSPSSGTSLSPAAAALASSAAAAAAAASPATVTLGALNAGGSHATQGASAWASACGWAAGLGHRQGASSNPEPPQPSPFDALAKKCSGVALLKNTLYSKPSGPYTSK